KITPSAELYHEPSKISAGIFSKPGIYAIRAVSGGKVAWLPLYISSKMMIIKKGDNAILVFTVDAKTGEILNSTTTSLYSEGKSVREVTPDNQGLSLIPLQDLNKSEIKTGLITSVVEGELVYSDPYFSFSEEEPVSYYSSIFTNQPVYRPGANVFFKGIIRFKIRGEMDFPSNEKIKVRVTDPSGTEIYKEELTLDEYGSFYSSVQTKTSFKPGTYYINAEYQNRWFGSTFTLEEYKKPEFKVDVQFKKNSYFMGEKITGSVKAGYFFGQPVAGASVKVRVLRKPYFTPWWLGSPYAWFYRYWDNYSRGNYEYVGELNGTLNADGYYDFDFDTDEDSTAGYSYSFQANVTDASKREIAGTGSVNVTLTDLIITAGTDRWFVKPGEEIYITANSYTADMSPKETELAVSVSKITYDNGDPNSKTVFETTVKTDVRGVAKIPYTPTEEGDYSVTLTGAGSNDKITTAETSFRCFSRKYAYYWWRSFNNSEIVTDKEAYLPGDTIKAVIYLPEKPKEGVVVIEQNSIISYHRVSVNDGLAEFNTVAAKEWAPAVNISFLAGANSNLIYTIKRVGIINDEAKLSVSITPSEPNFKPGAEAEFLVKVTDKYGKAVKGAQVAFGTADEAIYSVKPDNTEPLYDSFYPVEWYSTQTSSSLEGKYGQSMSRPLTLIDLDYNPKGRTSGNSSIEVKLKFDNFEEVGDKVKLLVTNGSLIKTQPYDGMNFTKFTDLPGGEFDICILTQNIVYPIKRVYVSENKSIAEEIYMEPLIEELNMYFSGYMAGGGAYAEDMALTKQGARNENAPSPDEENSSATVQVRENFVDSPFWAPSVITDRSGEATVSFNLPDNLTSWRSTVRVITKDTKTGEAVNNVIATKNLLVRLETPRFFKEGDTTMVVANIHNYLNTDAETKVKFSFTNLTPVSFDVKGVTVSKKTTDSFEAVISSKGIATVEIKTAVPFVNYNSELYIEAISDKESDALKIQVPVIPIGIKATNYLNDALQQGEPDKTLEFTIPTGVNMKTVSLALSVSPTIAATLLSSLDGLVDYPYGCVEQTMSRFLPALIVSNSFKKLGVPLSSSTMEKMPNVISKGLERLYDAQNSRGGWGWWKNDPTNYYMTAYVMYGLNMAKNLGYSINTSVFDKGLAALENSLSEKNVDKVTAAYAAWVYSGINRNARNIKPFLKLTDDLLADSLDAYSTSLLGLTFINIDDFATAKEIYKRLLQTANDDQNFISWGNDGYYTWQNDKIQATASALRFIIAVDSTSPAILKAANFLIREQKGKGWLSTQQTANVLFALTDYLLLTHELEPDFSAEIFLNGKQVKKVSFDAANMNPAVVVLTPDGTSVPFIYGKNTIKIVKKGKGVMYLGGENTLYYPDISFVKENKFTVTKEVFKLIETKTGNSIFYNKAIPDKVVTGDLLLVKIRVKTNRTNDQFLMVEDMLPAGFELVKEDYLYNIKGEQDHTGYWPGYWNRFYADQEVRDSKITFFVTYAPQEMEFSYILRAQLPGYYTVASVYAGLMYYPEMRGYGNRTLFRISQ
ncbi:MAG: hypothetical protein B6D45_01950, partial [Ignavibacteriales bacterium UTCHB3]